jgi:hypothetical protein
MAGILRRVDWKTVTFQRTEVLPGSSSPTTIPNVGTYATNSKSQNPRRHGAFSDAAVLQTSHSCKNLYIICGEIFDNVATFRKLFCFLLQGEDGKKYY